MLKIAGLAPFALAVLPFSAQAKTIKAPQAGDWRALQSPVRLDPRVASVGVARRF